MCILHDLFNELTNSKDKNSSKNDVYNFMDFVLGTELENRVPPFKRDKLKYLYDNDNANLSNDDLKQLANSTDWGFERFNQIMHPIKRIQYTCIAETYATSEAFSNHVKEVVFKRFFHTTTPEYKLLPTDIPQTCKNYIHWEAMESEIEKTICAEPHSLIFISGMPSSGKTQLLRSICSLKFQKVSYYYEFDPCIPLKVGFANITYVNKTDINLEKLFECLNSDYSDALLIIDKPDLKEDDFEFIRNELCKLNISIVISTQCKSIPTDYTVYDIDTRPSENLHHIYEAYTPKNRIDFSNKEFERFLTNISNNVYALSLFGKAIDKNPDKFNKDDLINYFSSYYFKNNMPKMHHAYKETAKTEQQLFTLLYRLVSNYASMDDLKDPKKNSKDSKKNSEDNSKFSFLLELSIWAIVPLSKKLLIDRFTTKQINAAISLGILQYDDTEKLYMPQLLADTIWNCSTPKITSDYATTITTILNALTFNNKFQIPCSDLYKIVFNLILRFYYQVSIIPSRPSTDEKDALKNWNLQLTYFIEGYMRLGNFQYAMNALPYLYITQKKRDENRVPSKVEDPQLNNFQLSVRKLLELQAKYMSASDRIIDSKNGETTDRIAIIDNFLQLASELQIYLRTEKKIDSTLFYLLSCIIQDMGVSAINISLHLVEYYFDNACLPSLQLIDTLCIIFKQCSNHFIYIGHLFPTFTAIAFQFADYYCSMHDFLLCIFKDQLSPEVPLMSFKKIIKETSDDELSFTAQCLHLYLSLVCVIKTTGNLDSIVNAYYDLCRIFDAHIWSYQASYLFFSCTWFLGASLMMTHWNTSANTSKLCKTLIYYYQYYRNYKTNQLSMTDSQLEKFYELFNDSTLMPFD